MIKPYTNRFIFWKTQSSFGSQTDQFFSDWAKKNYMTTNQENHTKMLQKMNPVLWDKFGNQIHLNQKFHPSMTGKFIHGQRESKTPNNYSRKKDFIMLQGPVQPKPPSFFEQAYKGREDWRKTSVSQTRPYSAYNAHGDAQSYMSHQRLKKAKDRPQKTLDPYGAKIKAKARNKHKNEEDDWERFNEELR